eukprot:CAMPEP_0202872744 /NCGR_PEP_ID=MMETSP1391-20130828/21897_1 /ASSEMBLY_ACC=CAM_ASM_000867 /TAXON_ID=1034604 /ORGANISM="Chlamydomonas leiostraca, Strain SAG 11-49" /LENGTH=336 /DNA_ID=CAMNT_0049553867 /DNA_START=546 /DNA_END=1556 /DNA_ORIENTATION=+
MAHYCRHVMLAHMLVLACSATCQFNISQSSCGDTADATPIIHSKVVFIVGAQKAATTTLFEMIVQAGIGLRPLKKEAHILDQPCINHTNFLSRYPETLTTGQWLIDASPSYLDVPVAALRVARLFPNSKIIAIIRDPVERALSAWNMLAERGVVTYDRREFLHNFTAELTNLENLRCMYGLKHQPTTAMWGQCFACHYQHNACQQPKYRNKCLLNDYGIIRKGLYAGQLAHWLSLIPKQRFLVVSFKQLTTHPHDVLKQVSTFLHTLASFNSTIAAIHANSSPTKWHVCDDPLLSEYLYSLYDGANQAMRLLLIKNGWQHAVHDLANASSLSVCLP